MMEVFACLKPDLTDVQKLAAGVQVEQSLYCSSALEWCFQLSDKLVCGELFA